MVIGVDIAAATEAGALINSDEHIVTGANPVDPLVSVEGEGLVVSSVKLAADQSGDLIVRVYESLGRRAVGRLQVNLPVVTAATVSLLEDHLEAAEVTDNSVDLRLGAFEVRTLRFTLGA